MKLWDKKVFLWDKEACCLNLTSHINLPWQIAWIIADKKGVIEKEVRYIKWDKLPISEEAAKITRFNWDVYNEKAQDPSEILEEFESYIYDDNYWAVGHNILNYDVYVHGIWREKLKKRKDYSYINRCIDTNCLAKAVEKQISYTSKNEDFIYWQYKLNHYIERGLKTNIGQQCKKHNLDFDENKAHDALYDIEKNYELLKIYARKLQIV